MRRPNERGDIHDHPPSGWNKGGLAYHECVTLLLDVAEVLGIEVGEFAAVLGERPGPRLSGGVGVGVCVGV